MGRFNRKKNSRRIKKTIVIVTEGENTEHFYFINKKAEIRSASIKINPGGISGNTTVAVVKKAYGYYKNISNEEQKRTTVWVVFDEDNNENFKNAVEEAKRLNINVAYSNKSFELWFLLHFLDMPSYLENKKLEKKVKGLFKEKYNIDYGKDKKNYYQYIKNLEKNAIENAEKLLKKYEDNGDSLTSNPSTTVHLLVNELNELKNK